MSRAPTTYRDYYRRWFKAFRIDLIRLGMEQVIGALLAILILAFQWYYGLIPQTHGWAEFKSIVWPYVVLLVVLTVISVIRAPVHLDRKRSAELENMDSERENLESQLKRKEDEEEQRSKLDFDFRLSTRQPFVPGIRMQITPTQNEFVQMPTMAITVWNMGRDYIQISMCKLSSDDPYREITIKSDQHIPPKPGEEILLVTEQLAEILFPSRNLQQIRENQNAHIDVQCRSYSGDHLTKNKSYRIEARKLGGMSLEMKIFPKE